VVAGAVVAAGGAAGRSGGMACRTGVKREKVGYPPGSDYGSVSQVQEGICGNQVTGSAGGAGTARASRCRRQVVLVA